MSLNRCFETPSQLNFILFCRVRNGADLQSAELPLGQNLGHQCSSWAGSFQRPSKCRAGPRQEVCWVLDGNPSQCTLINQVHWSAAFGLPECQLRSREQQVWSLIQFLCFFYFSLRVYFKGAIRDPHHQSFNGWDGKEGLKVWRNRTNIYNEELI